MRAIRISRFGGPEVLELVEDEREPETGPDADVLEVSGAGVNFADTHRTSNAYLREVALPFIPGQEAVGRLPSGERAVTLLNGGGYAEHVAAPRATTFALPDEVDDGQALALILQGTTAWHVLRTSGRLRPGESVLIHAAAGGVGSIAVQLARSWGAGRIIAIASTDEKRKLAMELGADTAIDANEPDLDAAIRAANGGAGVDLALESVGGATCDQTLEALGPFGRLVVFGRASKEPATPVDPRQLMQGSRSLVGFWLADCRPDPDRLIAPAMRELIDLTARGELSPVVGGTYPMSQASQAHTDLKARVSVGKLVLDPMR